MTEAPLPGDWMRLSDADVASWVRSRSECFVMGWPYNGTRRWYAAHSSQNGQKGSTSADYLRDLIRKQAEHHRMVFDHGVRVLVVPSFGNKNLARGSEYVRRALGGLPKLQDDEVYQQLMSDGLRIRFYGDYEQVLQSTLGTEQSRPLIEFCRNLMDRTSGGTGPVLLLGLFADDPYSTIARLSVEFYQANGRPPEHPELVEAYYGISMSNLDMYVGFAKPQLFNVPLLPTGAEQLYVTMNPSPDLSQAQLRLMLYDCLFLRGANPDYEAMSAQQREDLLHRLQESSEQTFGIGQIDPLTGGWRPLSPDCTTSHYVEHSMFS